jgi:hypothetical protein
VAEALADGRVGQSVLTDALAGVTRLSFNSSARQAVTTALAPDLALRDQIRCLLSRKDPVGATVLRDIFIRPFDRIKAMAAWRSTDVLGVARAIYEDLAFDRMPLLADALMDAGCEDEQILAHCRSAGPHVRGCWVVDLVLGKD